MTWLLKLAGVLTAAAWFGAVVLFTFGVSPALSSARIESLLGAKHFPYFGGAIELVAAERYYGWLLAFGVISLVHLLAEKLYLGRKPGRFWLGSLLALFGTVVLLGFILHPRLNEAHLLRHAVNASPAQKQGAERTFRALSKVELALNLFLMTGVGVYLWRVANPPETTRFVTPGKFRG